MSVFGKVVVVEIDVEEEEEEDVCKGTVKSCFLFSSCSCSFSFIKGSNNSYNKIRIC